MAQKSVVRIGVCVIDASRSLSDTPHSVGLLWTSDRPDADNTQHSQETSMTPAAFEPVIPAADPRLRPCFHLHR